MHTFRRYLALLLLAMLCAGCDSLPTAPTATLIPYDRHDVPAVLQAFARAGLPISDIEQDTDVQRDGPRVLKDRWVFAVPRIAPAGGQIVVFTDQSQQNEWTAFIERLRNDSDTRRDVVYTYFHSNIMLQLNAGLTNQEANAYRDALLTLP
ncbi:MAG: hypothetical protein SGJ24_06390 [Chloroflexota bacterium]|nr:hypothetical protein [Chloroflexota bacterium]